MKKLQDPGLIVPGIVPGITGLNGGSWGISNYQM
jgi:hypothetical protein